MNILNLLADNFTFDGVKFYKNSISLNLFGLELNIAYYAIAIVTGMVVAFFMARPLLKKQGLDPDLLLDFMIAVIPFSIIGARLWYVLNDLESFHSFEQVIDIRNGGLAIFGGVMGGALAIFIVCKIKKIPFLQIADVFCTALPLGQAIGRWGNFFNQEVYGLETSATFPFGVYISDIGGWRVALFFIESILNLALFIILYTYFLKRKSKNIGYSMCAYFLGYGIIRAILEQFRDPKFNLVVFGIRSQILTAILVILLGLVVTVLLLKRDGHLDKLKQKLLKSSNEKEE